LCNDEHKPLRVRTRYLPSVPYGVGYRFDDLPRVTRCLTSIAAAFIAIADRPFKMGFQRSRPNLVAALEPISS